MPVFTLPDQNVDIVSVVLAVMLFAIAVCCLCAVSSTNTDGKKIYGKDSDIKKIKL